MPLSLTATRELLAHLGHAPKQFLGQNFLVDGNIVRKSLELAEIAAGDTVVEVGPGLGTLTTALLAAGAHVWAVEKDRALHAHLETSLAPRFPDHFHLLEGDAIEQPLAGLPAGTSVAATALPAFKVVANLPYAIATPWLDAVLSGPLPARLVLMLQQEASQRYAAQSGTKSFGAISIFLQAAYLIAPGHKVAAPCFFPRPDVESHLIHLVRLRAPYTFTAPMKALIRSCFQQRRKQIGALLRARLGESRPDWPDLLRQVNISAQARPEAISVEAWIQLAQSLATLA